MYVSWSMAKGNNRSCTDRFKLPLLSHLSQTFITSCFKTWHKSSYNVHCKRKCSMSSMPSPQSQLLDASKPILCWWAFKISVGLFSLHVVSMRVHTCVDVTKHRTGRTVHTSAKYRSWVSMVKCVWCSACYWFRLRKGTGYGFHAFLTCILLLLLLIQCKISLHLGPVRPVRCFVTPAMLTDHWTYNFVELYYF